MHKALIFLKREKLQKIETCRYVKFSKVGERMSKMLSIVVPCHNEESMIPLFYEEVSNIDLPLDREYIFINDGSTDGTLNELRVLSDAAPGKVKYLSFSRNFGKESAIYAGLKEAKGEYVVLMDVDLQDPPNLLLEMYEKLITSEKDCIATKRSDRKGEPKIRSFFAEAFYKLNNHISDTKIIAGARDYRMMTRQMVDAILEVTEYNRFSKGIFSWVGFDTEYIEYENTERKAGETSWSFWGLLKYSVDGIVNYSEMPLTVATLLGWFIFLFSIFLAIFFFIRKLIFDNPTPGWTSLIVVILGLGGLQLLTIGILGKYIGKIYMESKNRPHYFIKETNKDRLEKKDEKR